MSIVSERLAELETKIAALTAERSALELELDRKAKLLLKAASEAGCIAWGWEKHGPRQQAKIREVADQLAEQFGGVTSHEPRVWKTVAEVPYGVVIVDDWNKGTCMKLSYGEIVDATGTVVDNSRAPFTEVLERPNE